MPLYPFDTAIMRKYDERDPERIAHYAGIMILPQPFVKHKVHTRS